MKLHANVAIYSCLDTATRILAFTLWPAIYRFITVSGLDQDSSTVRCVIEFDTNGLGSTSTGHGFSLLTG